MKGSFTEDLVNRANVWYLENNVAYFRKSHVPSLILDKYNGGSAMSRITDAGDIDYYGTFQGKYISFEVKETTKDYFLLSNIKPHQKQILLVLNSLSAISFLLLNFLEHPNSCFLIFSDTLSELWESGRKRISLEEADHLGRRVPFTYPGILNFLSVCIPGQTSQKSLVNDEF